MSDGAGRRTNAAQWTAAAGGAGQAGDLGPMPEWDLTEM